MTEDELDRCLMLMNATFRELVAGPDQVLEAQGLGRAHHRALFAMRRQPGIQVGALARVLAVTPQALHKTIRPLLDAGLAQARPHPKDARARTLHLTPAGAALEARISGMQREVFARAWAELGDDAHAEWVRLMQTVSRHAQRVRAGG